MRFALLILLTGSVFVSFSFAEDVGPAGASSLTLLQAVAAALERNPRLQEAQQRSRERIGDAIQATTLENPVLEGDWMRQVDPATSNGIEIELEQPLKLSHLTGSRATYAASLRELADRELRLDTLKTIAEVRTLYMQLWLLRRQKTVLEASASDSERAADVKKSAAAGQVAPSEESLFRGEAHRLRADIHALEAEIGQSEVLLGKEIGQNLAGVRLAEPVLSRIPADSAVLKQFAAGHTPVRGMLTAQLRAAEGRLGVAAEDTGFTFAPRLLYSRAGDGAEQGVGIGLALTIPLWDQRGREEAGAWGVAQRTEPARLLQRGASGHPDRATASKRPQAAGARREL